MTDENADATRAPEASGGVTRRRLLGAAGVGAVALGASAAGGYAVGNRPAPVVADPTAAPVPFEGVHQAGIVTPAQDRLYFVALDVTTDDRIEIVDLLRQWTDAARAMTAGNDVGEYGAVAGPPLAPPEDTGEALGLPPAALTITIGFGPSFFEKNGAARFGLAGRKPKALVDLPAFSGDRLDPALTGGDIAIQACANDPQVAVHAIRNLVRIGMGRVVVRWSQMGFGRTSSTSTGQVTPRNLFGFKDGTANIKAEEKKVVDRFVWADGDQTWMKGGSYLVARKIAMRIETWDRESLQGQELIFGRDKRSGGPLSGGDEFVAPDFTAKNADGDLAIPVTSHVHRAHPDFNGGIQILRRGYNYVEGSDGLGQLSAGLFFISYQADPEQFITIQRNLAGQLNDALNEYIVHVGSGVWACPPGVSQGGYWGEALLAK